MTEQQLTVNQARTQLGNRLSTLREQQNLTLHEAAILLDLGSANGRHTLSRWELNRNMRRGPQQRHRENVLRYLWHGLGLRNQPQQLEQIWELICLGWDWEPLSEEDRATVTSAESAQIAAELYARMQQQGSTPSTQSFEEGDDQEEEIEDGNTTSAEIAGNLLESSKTLEAVTTRTVPQSPNGQAATTKEANLTLPNLPSNGSTDINGDKVTLQKTKGIPQVTYRIWGVIGLLLLGSLALWGVSARDSDRQATEMAIPTNLDFEQGDLSAWLVHDGACTKVIEDESSAAHGRYFAEIDSSIDGCTSISYDFHLPFTIGDTLRFAIYVQSAEPRLQEVETVFWTGQHPLEKNGVDLDLYQVATNYVEQGQWRCLETTYTIATSEYDVVRAALHWPKEKATHLLIDNAQISFGDQSLCQSQPPHILDGDFEQTQEMLSWVFNGAEACDWALTQEAAEAYSGRKALQIDRKTADCASIAQHIPTTPRTGTTYRAAAWVHVEPEIWGTATWSLWARGQENVQRTHFTRLAGDEWRCLEAELVIPEGTFDHLAVELHLEAPNTIYTIDHVQIATTNTPLCPPQERLLNADFETGEIAVGWVQHANGECKPEAIEDSTTAQQGSQFVRISKTGTCYSLFQDVYQTPQAGDTATFGLWARAQSADPAHVRLQLFALETPLATKESNFFLYDNEWTCLQTTLTIDESVYRYWRGEIHFHTDGVDYELDNAQFRLDGKSICPENQYDVMTYELLPGQQAVSGATISGRLVVENSGKQPTPATTIRYWLADTSIGSPLSGESMGALRLSPLKSAEQSPVYYFDLRLPLRLEAKSTYYIPLELSAAAPGSALYRPPHIRFTVAECSEETLFCDIPNGYWAQAEAEAAHALGITGGCRSDAQAYNNLPFCPHQILWPEQMAVFFLRYLNGGNYRPVGRFQAHYTDVAEEQNFAYWIDAFYPVIGEFERVNCPQIENQPYFCKEQPILRRDLLRAIGQVLQIDASAATDAIHYVDLSESPELEQLANYLWTHNVLPDLDPNCTNKGFGARFCGEEPARRIDAIVWMSRAFALNQ